VIWDGDLGGGRGRNGWSGRDRGRERNGGSGRDRGRARIGGSGSESRSREIDGGKEIDRAGEIEREGEIDGGREIDEAGDIEGERGLEGNGGSMSCLLAASIRTFSCERKGIPRMASYKGRGATAKIAGLMLVQDLEGIET
jgi:hypothetical protein